jgi:hypothetical protein
MARTIPDVFDLDRPAFWLSPSDAVRPRDLEQGTLVLSQTGGGKSSGPAAAIRRALVCGGYGITVMVAKDEETQVWIKEAIACGRERSLIVFGEHDGFNFLHHSQCLHGEDGVGAAVEDTMRVFSISRSVAADSGRPQESFWQDEARGRLRNIYPILHHATGNIEVDDIVAFLQTAPKSAEELFDEQWRSHSPMFQWLKAASRTMPPDEYKRIANYWQYEYATQNERLRSNIDTSVTSLFGRFRNGWLRRALAGKTTITPELMYQGYIIILNAPAVTKGDDGIIFQQVFVNAAQRAILTRGVHRSASGYRQDVRPVALYADEGQNFINSYWAPFLAESRSSRCATVMLTQSIQTIYAKFANDGGKYGGDNFVAQFNTKVIGSCCYETGKFAADTIGRSLQWRANFNRGESSGWSSGVSLSEGSSSGTNSGFTISPDGKGGTNTSYTSGQNSGDNESEGRNRGANTGVSTSSGGSQTLDYQIEPSAFARMLRTGGPANNFIVDAVWLQAGRRFNASGQPWLFTSFRQ